MGRNNTKRKNRYVKEPGQPHPARRTMAVALQAMTGTAVIIGMSLVFVFSHDWITQCDYFRAERVIVEGTQRLDPIDIQKAANIWEGVNILSVNLTTVRKRLLTEPWIADVDIRRDFPATIEIIIREHRPLAVIDLGRYFLVNTDGEIFKEADQVPDLPVISGVDYLDWKTGGKAGAKVFDAVMDVLRRGRDENSMLSNCNIEKILVDKEIGLALRTRTPAAEIRIGYGDYGTKFRRFARIVSYLDGSQQEIPFESMDIRNPDRIVAKPVSERAPSREKEV